VSDLRARVGPLGDQAVLLTLDGDRERCNLAIVGIAAALLADTRTAGPRSIVDVVPALTSLAVFYDRTAVSADAVARRLTLLADRANEFGQLAHQGQLHVVAVHYDGPDLAEVARLTGLDPPEIARRHAAREYRVRFLGFAPGFAYLGPLDPSLVVPRRSDPRRRILAGSVAIAGDQTAVYPLDTPGGWHLIGRTDARPFDPSQSPPSRFAIGDRVRFQPTAP
jgi:KipI family sensor histidine kinase inhibitor